MAIKAYFTLHKAPGIKPHNQFSVIPTTLIDGVLYPSAKSQWTYATASKDRVGLVWVFIKKVHSFSFASPGFMAYKLLQVIKCQILFKAYQPL